MLYAVSCYCNYCMSAGRGALVLVDTKVTMSKVELIASPFISVLTLQMTRKVSASTSQVNILANNRREYS